MTLPATLEGDMFKFCSRRGGCTAVLSGTALQTRLRRTNLSDARQAMHGNNASISAKNPE